MIIAAGVCTAVFVAVVWAHSRRQRWQLKWVAKWAHEASPRYELAPPPPNLAPDMLRWAIGFKHWSQALQRDLVEVRDRRQLAAEIGIQNERFHARLRHDLRTPLNAMMGFSDLLLQGIDGPIEEVDKRVVESISASSRRLHHRVEEVLSDSIGIAVVDHEDETDERPVLRSVERVRASYPLPPRWMLPVSLQTCLAFGVFSLLFVVYLFVFGEWLAFASCMVGVLGASVLCLRVRRESTRIARQGESLREGHEVHIKSVDTLDAALRSFELRARDSRQKESTATHFLAERDRKRNHRIAHSAATLREPLDEVRGGTAELLQRAHLNQKQRDSLMHVLRSANLLNMALEELFLLVDYEGDFVQVEPRWVPTVELITKSIARLRHALGDDVRVHVVVMPGIAPLCLDAAHFFVAFAGLLRFVLKRSEGTGVQIWARSDADHVIIHFQDDRVERHDTVPGRREQELSVLNSGPKLMRLVMEHVAGECHYQLEGALEGRLVFPRHERREMT